MHKATPPPGGDGTSRGSKGAVGVLCSCSGPLPSLCQATHARWRVVLCSHSSSGPSKKCSPRGHRRLPTVTCTVQPAHRDRKHFRPSPRTGLTAVRMDWRACPAQSLDPTPCQPEGLGWGPSGFQGRISQSKTWGWRMLEMDFCKTIKNGKITDPG